MRSLECVCVCKPLSSMGGTCLPAHACGCGCKLLHSCTFSLERYYRLNDYRMFWFEEDKNEDGYAFQVNCNRIYEWIVAILQFYHRLIHIIDKVSILSNENAH